jgi:type VI protein secretion system component Hcp
MSRSRLVVIGAVVSIVAAFGVAPVAQAAEDYFLVIRSGTSTPIQGEAMDANFSETPRAIVLNSFDWSATNPVAPGSTAGKVSLNRLTVEKRIDSASVALFQRVANGVPMPSMELFVRQAGTTGKGYLKYRFANVYVSSVSPSGDAAAETRERVTFAYGAVAVSYTQLSDTGPPRGVFEGGWNALTNMACGYTVCNGLSG